MLGRLRDHEQPYNLQGSNVFRALMMPLAAVGSQYSNRDTTASTND